MYKDYNNLTEKQKEQLVNQFSPLINKLTQQYSRKNPNVDYLSIKSMALEGLSMAFIQYDENRSKMTFMQYAAFAIRNNILNCLQYETRVIHMSWYATNKAKDIDPKLLFNTVSIDNIYNDPQEDSDSFGADLKMQMANKLENSLTYVANVEEDPFKYLFDKLEKVFSERDCDIFYKVFGINGVEQMKGFEVANEYGVSAGLISQKISKMIKWIKEDKDLFERLGELL